MNFEMSESDYINFSSLIYTKAGINLHEGKKNLLKTRLSKYLRKTRFRSVREYYQYLMNDVTGEELVHLLDIISTNLTYFFREPKHYEFLRNKALPQVLESCRSLNKQVIRIWSAGCSSGEEAYSIGIVLNEFLDSRERLQIHIFATDISTKVLKKASDGIYEGEKLEKIPYDLRSRYFQRGVNKHSGYFRVKPQLRKLISFERLNLMEPFPTGQTFQIIFCRNVMIYFDKPTQERIVEKFYGALEKGGFFFIGHSESLTNINHTLRYIQPSVYRK
jgi:chemotaxis protein methyltransferase CheR